MSLPSLYLASASPRRAELLQQLGVGHRVIRLAVDETALAGESPEAFVQRVALDKARAGWAQLEHDQHRPVLGADTVVVVDGQILGKPRDRDHALAMLAQLSGREHRVLSAVAVVGENSIEGMAPGAGMFTENMVDEADLGQDKGVVRERQRLSESQVWFRAISDAERAAYWATGEPADKAGAYAIQGLGALFIERLAGSYSGVMGLPLFETGELLTDFGIHILAP